MKLKSAVHSGICFCFITGLLASQAGIVSAHGPRGGHRHHHHHHHSSGAGTAIAFTVGALAGYLASPPPPPAVIHHHHGPYPPGPRYYMAPPVVVQPEVIYQPVPTPVIVNSPAQIPAPTIVEKAPAPAQPRLSGPTLVNRPAVGTVVDRLPPMAQRVERGGVTYFEAGGVYYLPVQFGTESRFVIVQPQ